MKRWVTVSVLVALLSGGLGGIIADRWATAPRILVTMTSSDKPIFASAQILRLMHQDYRNFKVSVSIKGMDGVAGYNVFWAEWMPFVREGRLRVTRDTEKTPLENWADTVKSEDLSAYDIVCFIKDENWYAPDYLKTVARAFDTQKMAFLAVTPFLTAVWTPAVITTHETHAVHGAGNVCISSQTAQELVAFIQAPARLKAVLPPALQDRMTDVSPVTIAYYFAMKYKKAFSLTPPRPLMIDDTNTPVFSSY